MSKHNHNYSQYSNKNRNNAVNATPANEVKVEHKQNYNKPVEQQIEVKPEIKPEIKPEVKLVTETVETVALPETIEGFVVNCAKLNVREKASTDSNIVCVLNSMSDIRVDVAKSNNKWVYVYTASGLEGYCMREYIDARL